MKNKLYGYRIFVLLFLVVLLAACKESKLAQEDEEQDGKWGDVIGFSQDEVLFNAEAGETEVTTKGRWWLTAFVNERYGCLQPIDENDTINIYTYDWVSIQKLESRKVKVSVKENTSEKPRSVRVQFQAGDYFGYLKVEQKGAE